MSGASQQAQIEKYNRRSPEAKHLLQLCAVNYDGINRTDMVALSQHCGWRDKNGKKLEYKEVRSQIESMVNDGLLVRGAGGSLSVQRLLLDFVVQEAIRSGHFEQFAAKVQEKKPRGEYYRYYYGREQDRFQRDLRIAFYRSDVRAMKSLAKNATFTLLGEEDCLGVLTPFDAGIFARLDPILQQQYLIEALQIALLTGDCSPEIQAGLDQFHADHPQIEQELLARIIDVTAARGDVAGLKALARQTEGEYPEIDGCAAFLRGNWDEAEARFEDAVKQVRRKTRQRNIAIKYLPAIFHLVLLIRRNSPEARKQAETMLRRIESDWAHSFRPLGWTITYALNFQANPAAGNAMFYGHWFAHTPALCNLIAGYCWRWLQPESDSPLVSRSIEAAFSRYDALDYKWIAAELAALLGFSPVERAKSFADQSAKIHGELKTATAFDMITPESAWERALSALQQIADPSNGTTATTNNEASERLVWELAFRNNSDHIVLRPLIQKRKKRGGWTDGRAVSLQRLYSASEDRETFGFLSDHDRAVCRCIEEDVSYAYYGRYREKEYSFNLGRVAQTLVGHPHVFRAGDRSEPLEVTRHEPHLIVSKEGKDAFRITLEPAPHEADMIVTEDGPRRVSFVCFSSKHRDVYKILGEKGLKIPASGKQQVLATLQSIASLVTVHSEIGGGDVESGKTVESDPRPHVHLVPYQSGLRAEFYVRSFGSDGPFYRPGQGGENVFAEVGGEKMSTRRELQKEKSLASRVIESCLALREQRVNDDLDAEFIFPTPLESLELALQLRPLVESEQVVLHWPKGKKFNVVKESDGSTFRMSIRRDKDWFAASGELKVDEELTLDMMKLLELSELSGSRFIELDDGKYLALTDEFRRRISELNAFAEVRKNVLRFPRVRAAAIEEVAESFDLKTDKEWKNYVTRLHESHSLAVEVPSTFHGDLRDYQREGFEWLCRLAHWGVGACLADDMGLGKTIQAISLLLYRGGDGPALIVAPTSVAFNWLNEIQRFAPTLNARIFGGGDREAFLQELGPRDVVITSYGLLYNEAERFQARRWHTAILDEAQAIKNTATKRSQAAMGLEAEFRVILTGTPLENHLGELWNLFQFINPGLLGSLKVFQDRFANPIERDQDRGARWHLKKLIQPFILRRNKTQVLQELPSRTEITLQVELSHEEAAFYEALRQRAIEKFSKQDGEDNSSAHIKILAEIMRLRRACCHPKLVAEGSVIPSSKLALFLETLEELLDNRHKVLVFSQFVDHLSILREALDANDISYQYLDGGTPAKQRKERVEAFQRGEGDVFLISLKAGGLGLNLTAADYVMHMDPWWNPAVEDQASDRAHRLGQTRPVTIYRFVTKGTIEEQIVDLHSTKRDLADSLLEGSDMSGKLSSEELLKLIRE
ncbi:MAG: DEAD/DEAH box helicase [Planctomycetaceae bacterium]|nr:DEAD/DEAH box helicase [Planctomycetales bacterium]MCB9926357.1 DEAD/DEAH box helicase [Planctomycetaceae bacterium]